MIPISELDLIKIGEIIKAHGYKGELVIKLSKDFNRLKKTELLFFDIDRNKVPFFFSYTPKKFKKSGMLAKFDNLDSDIEVEAILNSSVYTTADKLTVEEPNIIETIEGYDVYDNDKIIGKAGEFLNIPSNPILTVITDTGNEILIPVNDEFIIEIDNTSKKIIFDLPDGLLDINA